MMGFVRRLMGGHGDRAGSSDDGDDWGISAGDRAGMPVPRKRRKWLLRSVVMLSLAGAGYALYDEPSRGARWWTTANDFVGPMIERALSKTDVSAIKEAAARAAPIPQDLAAKSIAGNTLQAMPEPTSVKEPSTPAAAGLPVDKQPELPVKTAALPPARAKVEMPAYAPPQEVTVVDPMEARAKAVGLHPDLSRALLVKLSDADFKNAAFATRTAVAKTPDDGTFRWPRNQGAGVAVFEVHFVAGAPTDCRRYVVTIAKDKWTTTAPPVDMCGVGRSH